MGYGAGGKEGNRERFQSPGGSWVDKILSNLCKANHNISGVARPQRQSHVCECVCVCMRQSLCLPVYPCVVPGPHIVFQKRKARHPPG